jgi:hypothetical protein
MAYDGKTVDRTLLTMGGREGEILALLIFTDGGYGIARDGRPLDGHYWPETALHDCISKMLWLAEKGQHVDR